jgi:adenylate cyclase
MAFWGAPIATEKHAHLAVAAAHAMVQEVALIQQEHKARGLPAIGLGIGISTGVMCVGDMGSDIRRSYTVIGDTVNLGARLESLSKVYGCEVVASANARMQAPDWAWQQLDTVRVKGKAQAISIYCPWGPAQTLTDQQKAQLQAWDIFLAHYRQQNWDACTQMLRTLQNQNPDSALYQLYVDRIAARQMLPFDPQWDATTTLTHK